MAVSSGRIRQAVSFKTHFKLMCIRCLVDVKEPNKDIERVNGHRNFNLMIKICADKQMALVYKFYEKRDYKDKSVVTRGLLHPRRKSII